MIDQPTLLCEICGAVPKHEVLTHAVQSPTTNFSREVHRLSCINQGNHERPHETFPTKMQAVEYWNAINTIVPYCPACSTDKEPAYIKPSLSGFGKPGLYYFQCFHCRLSTPVQSTKNLALIAWYRIAQAIDPYNYQHEYERVLRELNIKWLAEPYRFQR